MKIWKKAKEIDGEKFLVVRRDGSVPCWPYFVLGARDPHAAMALRAYGAAVFGDPKGDKEYAKSIFDLADDFDAYRAAQGENDPSAPPHRKDDPDVIAAMRGSFAIIQVSPDNGNVKKEGA